ATPIAPTASIDAASNLCYDPSTSGATLVVSATGGQPPYDYNINGGAFNSSNTFTALTPGSYTIIVRDAYGCTFTLPVQTIAPELTLSTVLTKDLDCTVSPDAVITGTITGGTAPYTLELSTGGGAYAAITPPTGLSFTDTQTTDNTYQY
ncbi:hypothetical protein, partial [Flavivirga aquatica]|uniref:hypothetical protein n=1 Tax=Flavivirga aquatica TaxID=1849968 RepID=UPI000B29C712